MERLGRSIGGWIALTVLLLQIASTAHARRIFARNEGKPCAYCHVSEKGGGPRNYRGIFYKLNELSFDGFDDAAEAKKAGVPIGPEPLPPPKSYVAPIKVDLPPDTADPNAVPDFGTATFSGIAFIKIPAGTYQRGTDPAQQKMLEGYGAWSRMNNDETPAKIVRITKPFFLSKYEVTQQQWQIIMAKAPPGTGLRKNPSAFKGDPNLPVDSVGWNDAQNFCRELSKRYTGKSLYRLPTETEWEYAARAGSSDILPLGTDKAPLTAQTMADYAWFSVNAGGKTHPVGQKKPNAWGLYDMLGNVWEWCADGYAPDFYATDTGIDPIAKPPVVNERVLRGGSWFLDARAVRPAVRGGALPNAKTQYFGFRIVRDL